VNDLAAAPETIGIATRQAMIKNATDPSLPDKCEPPKLTYHTFRLTDTILLLHRLMKQGSAHFPDLLVEPRVSIYSS